MFSKKLYFNILNSNSQKGNKCGHSKTWQRRSNTVIQIMKKKMNHLKICRNLDEILFQVHDLRLDSFV